MKTVATEYGQAMYDLATDEGISEEILTQLDVVGQAVGEEKGILRILSAPNLPKEERCAILDECFGGKVHPYVLNFFKLLTERGYARHIPECCSVYHTLYNEGHDILPVRAVTAVPLTADQADRLSGKLKTMTGKHIELHNVVDEQCLGGIRLDYDGKRVDDTVQHRLDAMRSLLNSTVL